MASNETKHTPTPWKYNDITGEIESGEVAVARMVVARMRGHAPDTDLMDANGEHVVLCVNTHDALVDALEDALRRIRASDEWWMDSPDRGGFDAEKIEAVLALARGGQQ